MEKYIIHQGYLLQEFVNKSADYNTDEIGATIGVSRQTVYLMYGYVELKPEVIKKLKDAKIRIAGITDNNEKVTKIIDSPDMLEEPNAPYNKSKMAASPDKEISYLKELLKAKDQTISVYEASFRALTGSGGKKG